MSVFNILYILIGITMIGFFIFLLSGKCLTNGIDMPKPAVIGIVIFLSGCTGIIIFVLRKHIIILYALKIENLLTENNNH